MLNCYCYHDFASMLPVSMSPCSSQDVEDTFRECSENKYAIRNGEFRQYSFIADGRNFE
jgi:hypothetical protein